ncbi:hypothetical protein JVT61DRAFT_3704 [Boletus reticuloceps]|uniref:Uncharacterized protein n=1 Tax=Boletus reticuloceps TaxID=495285 RepID=A0A8I2YLI5_9AGAM|nr:hypothetical protein JVT61DRAFT_3704 [Boletus reticuloceps]
MCTLGSQTISRTLFPCCICSHWALVIGFVHHTFGYCTHHPSPLRAYSITINLLPQLGLSVTHRYAEFKRGANLSVCEAAATALGSGFPELAVEWLEQGRSIVWGELLRLRGSYDQLSSAHPDHARQLRELSAALDDAGATREKSLSTSALTDDANIAASR